MTNTRSFLPGNWVDKVKKLKQYRKKYEQAAKKREQRRAEKLPVQK